MIKLKDVVWSEVELVEGNDTNNKGGDVSVMTCCGWPPPINIYCNPKPIPPEGIMVLCGSHP